MAIGDDAAAAGMDLVPSTGKVKDGATEMNKTRDYIAKRTSAITPVAKGGTGASTSGGARANLGVPAKNSFDQPYAIAQIEAAGAGHIGVYYNVAAGRAVFRVQGVASDIAVATPDNVLEAWNRAGSAQAAADSAQGTANGAQGTANDANTKATEAKQGRLWNDTYNRSIGGTRRAVWVQDDGQLGYAASTERYKKHLRPEDVTDEQITMLTLVSYQWKVAITRDDHREMGLIAERLVEAGLGWACFFNADGTVEGINYEMIGLALLPAVQRLIGRVAALEAR